MNQDCPLVQVVREPGYADVIVLRSEELTAARVPCSAPIQPIGVTYTAMRVSRMIFDATLPMASRFQNP